jgi:hypothetical protein
MDTRIEAGDKIVAISEDDDTIRLSGVTHYDIDTNAIRQVRSNHRLAERTLILGWNRRAPIIVNELDNYVEAGSEVTVVADVVDGEAILANSCGGLRNQKATFKHGDITSRRLLEKLDILTYNHVIVLSYSDSLEPQEADARTLVTLLHLRDMADHSKRNFAIVSEMLDVRNRELAEVTRADDFIVSDKLISLMLSQISENKDLTAVFQDLFDPEGSELYLKPAADYVELGKPVNFYTIVESARRRGETAIGYRLDAKHDNPVEAYGVTVNPNKSGIITFAERDRIIVLAEE